MPDKTRPKSVRTKALHAIAAIHAWNAAVHQARRLARRGPVRGLRGIRARLGG
jgi:hypothetical protein